MLCCVVLASLLSAPLPAQANDSVAGLGAGGLILGRTDSISMDKEDLFISMDEVKVDYVFRNTADKDVETIVAFPMPDIDANPNWMPNLPDDTSDNFLGFEVSVDGAEMAPQLEQKAFAVGVDITEELKAKEVPASPFLKATTDALAKPSETDATDWIDRGLIYIDSYDDGSGWKHVRTPIWALKSTYWWKAKFPAGKTVSVSHRYKPSLSSAAGVGFFYDGKFQDGYAEDKQRYCIDANFEKAILKAAKQGPDGSLAMGQNAIEYVLTTGGNWALGNIGEFNLTIDKGHAKNLVSFCGEGVTKTGPTRFEIHARDFSPEKDLEVLILVPRGEGGSAN